MKRLAQKFYSSFQKKNRTSFWNRFFPKNSAWFQASTGTTASQPNPPTYPPATNKAL